MAFIVLAERIPVWDGSYAAFTAKISSWKGFPAKFLSICMPLIGHDAPPARGYLTIEGVY